MLKPIPARILRTTANVAACVGVDVYQNQLYETHTVKRTHLQPTNEVRKTENNTEVVLRSILFVDGQLSTPRLDWAALFQRAHNAAGDMRVTVRGVEYTVAGVDELRDDTDHFHHWEIALV